MRRDARWERDGELEHAVVQFGWDQGEVKRHRVGADG